MERVLVVRFSSLGDTVLTLSAIDHLVKSQNEVHVLTKTAFAPVFELYGPAVRVHTISNHASFGELWAKVKELRGLNFDRVVDLHRNLRSFLVIFGMRAGKGIGPKAAVRRIRKYRFRELFLYLFHGKLFGMLGFHPLDRAGEALRVVGGEGFRPTLLSREHGALPGFEAQAIRGLQGNRYVCVVVESAWPQKQWSQQKYFDLALKIQSELGVQVVWAGLNPLPFAERLEGSVDLTTKLELPQVARLLQGAALLVCNDSGLMHLAESVNTPVVAIFGPTSEELGFAPKLSKSRRVEKQLWCRPCSKTGRWCIRLSRRWRCLTDIMVDDVLSQVRQAL